VTQGKLGQVGESRIEELPECEMAGLSEDVLGVEREGGHMSIRLQEVQKFRRVGHPKRKCVHIGIPLLRQNTFLENLSKIDRKIIDSFPTLPQLARVVNINVSFPSSCVLPCFSSTYENQAHTTAEVNLREVYYYCPPQTFLKFSGLKDSGMERYPSPFAAEIHFYCFKNSVQF